MQEVLDPENALDLARLTGELLREVLLDLSAQVDDAVFGVDIDLALRHLGVAEDLGLDLARERHVVRLRLLLFGAVRRLCLQALGLGADTLRLLRALTHVFPGLVAEDLPSPAAVVRVEEVRERGSDRSCKRK